MYKNTQKHSFHLVDPSLWPIVSAFSALMLTFGGVLYFHSYSNGSFLWRFGFLMLLFSMYGWWRDVIREGTYEGQHTKSVQTGLKLGVIFFIVSEIMFFFAFFWAFFHVSLNPSVAIGSVWPPVDFPILDPWQLPLANTFILVSSGIMLTSTHYAILAGNKTEACKSLLIVLFMAILFTLNQGYEYITAPFFISSGIYGSVFYLATGFHGFHVIIGTCFLTVCLFRIYFNHFTVEHHIGFEAAAWYWHFVDVVWIFLYITIYWWGS